MSGPPVARRCARCGAEVEARARRCRRCLTDLLVSPPTVQASPLRRAGLRERLALPSRRAVVLVALIALVIWFVVPVVWPDPTPRTPSAVRSAEAGPTAWGLAHGNPGATRATSASAHLQREILWSVSLDAAPSAPAVADGSAMYVPLDDGRLLAVGSDDGAILWGREYDHTLNVAAAVAGDRVYVVDRTGVLEALDARTGERVWATAALGGYAAAPLVSAGSVYAYFGVAPNTADQGVLAQVDAETGALLWRARAVSGLPALALAADDTHLVLAGTGTIEFYRRDSGRRSFWYVVGQAPRFVAIADGEVHAVTARQVVALDRDASRPWWEAVRGFWRRLAIIGAAPMPPPAPTRWIATAPPLADAWSPVVTAEALVIATPSGAVVALDRATGEPLWHTQAEPVTGPPVATAEGLLLVHARGLALLDIHTGDVLEQRSVEGVAGRLVQAIPTRDGTWLVTSEGEILGLVASPH